jgi:hypothetical protein
MALRKTRLELQSAIRTNWDEISPSFWPVGDPIQFINRAKDRVVLEVRKAQQDYLEVTRTSLDGALTILGESYNASAFRLVVGVRDYLLPPDFSELVSNQCISSGFEWLRLTYRRPSAPDFRRALEETNPQTPRYYTLLGERTWRVAPKPDATYEFDLTYVPVIPDLATDASTLELPHPLYMAVEQYATAEGLMKDHSPDAAAWEAKGNATIALFLGANARQSTDTEYVHGYLEES